MKSFEEQLAEWKQAAEGLGAGRKVEQLLYYPKEDSGEYAARIGFPGAYPFTRGIHPAMYNSKLWTMRQYAGFGNARETNRRIRYLLEKGQSGISLAFDLPTQLGYDPGHPLAEGEAGRVGVSVSSLADMETIFHGIPLDAVSTSMTINAPAAVLMAMYMAVAEKRGIPWSVLNGTVQNDILKEYTARGTYIFPPEPALRLTVDLAEFLQIHAPNWNALSVGGYHMREAGATAAQEIAFAFSNAICYLERSRERGLDVEAVASRLSFFFAAHSGLFEEAAKFRAARRLWARIMRERFGALTDKACQLRFHTQTGGVTLTAQQPDNNAARVTLQALSAVLGGTQSLHTNAKDEAWGLPTESSALSALRIQQVLAYESGAAEVVDPLAGSYYVESLTDQLEAEASAIISQLDTMGGSVAAVHSGWMRNEIRRSAFERDSAIQSGATTIVGLNRFLSEESELSKLSPTKKTKASAPAKARRQEPIVRMELDSLRNAAYGNGNLMPFIMNAVHAYATLGEICGVLREVFGEHREVEEPWNFH